MTKIDIHTLSVPDQADGFIGYWLKDTMNLKIL